MTDPPRGSPGEVLRAALEELGMYQSDFARRTGLSEKHVSQVIHGRVGFSADTAVKFERVTGVSAQRWLSLQADYRVEQLRHPLSFKNREGVDLFVAPPKATVETRLARLEQRTELLWNNSVFNDD